MEGLSTSIFLSLSVLYMVISYVRSELSGEECLKLGFNKSNLLCSSCDILENFDLNSLKDPCYDCCTAGAGAEPGAGGEGAKKYHSARLEVCG